MKKCKTIKSPGMMPYFFKSPNITPILYSTEEKKSTPTSQRVLTDVWDKNILFSEIVNV